MPRALRAHRSAQNISPVVCQMRYDVAQALWLNWGHAMPFYKNWGFALLVIWFVTFFVNWAIYGGDPFGLIGLELVATLAWLITWRVWLAVEHSRRPPGAQVKHPDEVPVHLWVVTGLAVIWSLMGAAGYMARQTRVDTLFPPYPFWIDAAWAMGVWGGLAGSLLLIVRVRYAVPVFAVSAAGLLVEALHARPYWLQTAAPGFLVFQGFVIALLLLLYAWRMQRREELRQRAALGQ